MYTGILKGLTSQSLYLMIRRSDTGLALTGVAFNTASLVAYYKRGNSAAVAITLATLANSEAAYSSGGFVEVSAANMPGLYRLDLPDAAIADGARGVIVSLSGAANMDAVTIYIPLENLDRHVSLGQPQTPAGFPNPDNGLILVGVAQAAAAGSITLPASFSAANDVIIGAVVFVWSSTNGRMGRRVITDWDDTTKVATLDANWVVTPTGTISIAVFASPEVRNSDIAAAFGTRSIPDSYAPAGAQPTIDQALLLLHQAIRDLRQKSGSPNTLEVLKPDGTTPSGVELTLAPTFADPTTRTG